MNRIQSRAPRLVALAMLACPLYVMPVFAQAVLECTGQLPSSVRLPDLMNIVPHHIHVQEKQQQHRLMFTVGIANVGQGPLELAPATALTEDRKSTRLNSSHLGISYAVFCLKKKH